MWRIGARNTVAGPEIAGKVLPFGFGSNTDHGVIVMASRQVRGMDHHLSKPTPLVISIYG